MREGKNREVRNVLGHLGLAVNRLIRVSYGPFQLTGLAEGAIEEVKTRILREQLGERLVELSGADFSAPVRASSRCRKRHPLPVTLRRDPRAVEPGEPRRATARIRCARASPSRRSLRRSPQDDGGKTAARSGKPVRRRSRRSEAERLGEPELARREKRHGRKRVRGHAPPRGKKR